MPLPLVKKFKAQCFGIVLWNSAVIQPLIDGGGVDIRPVYKIGTHPTSQEIFIATNFLYNRLHIF